MWPKCGTGWVVKNGLTAGNARNRGRHETVGLVLTTTAGGSYKAPHSGAPSVYGRDCSPQKLLTDSGEIPPIRLGGLSFVGSPDRRGMESRDSGLFDR